MVAADLFQKAKPGGCSCRETTSHDAAIRAEIPQNHRKVVTELLRPCRMNLLLSAWCPTLSAKPSKEVPQDLARIARPGGSLSMRRGRGGWRRRRMRRIHARFWSTHAGGFRSRPPRTSVAYFLGTGTRHAMSGLARHSHSRLWGRFGGDPLRGAAMLLHSLRKPG